MITIRTLRDPVRTLEQAVLDCYLTAIKHRDFERASWIARNFPVQLPVTFNVSTMARVA